MFRICGAAIASIVFVGLSQFAALAQDFGNPVSETAAQYADSTGSGEMMSPELAPPRGATEYAEPVLRNLTIHAGAEATFLNPQFNGQFDTVTLDDVLAGATTTFSADNASLGGLRLAPRFWLGLSSQSSWGVRVRYWELNQVANANDPFDPIGIAGDLSGFAAASSLKMHAIDLEGTKGMQLGRWDVLASIGARQARLERGASLSATGLVDLGGGAFDVLTGSTFSGASFDGTGLTTSLQGTRDFVSCDWGSFGLFGAARGSVLWGNSRSYASASAAVFGPGLADGDLNSQALGNVTDHLYILEVQAGLQWSRILPQSCNRAFARVCIEYQSWDLSNGAPTAAISGAGRPGASNVSASATSRNLGNLDLIGFGLTAGFQW